MKASPVSHGSSPAILVTVAGWAVDASTLRITKDGKATKLEPRAMAVLTFLASQPGRTVSREELEREVWQGQVVVYEALSNAIAKLRKAFADDPHDPRVIETIPKVGYRLIAEVSGSPRESAIPVAAGALFKRLTPPVRWFLGAGAVVLVVAIIGIAAVWPGFSQSLDASSVSHPHAAATTREGKPSIAVLPFTNMSGDPEQEYFADGMTDDLITDLSKISGLFVIARNSTFKYKGKSPDVSRLSRELGARYVVEGSVRLVEGQVRINAQLIDAISGGHVWAERYDSPLTDNFVAQDEITQSIVMALSVRLTEEEESRQALRETNSLEGYDAFLRGVTHYYQYSRHDHAKAAQYFEKAIALDPNYSRAHSWLAAVYWESVSNDWSRSLGISVDDAMTKVKQHLAEALKDPDARAHFVVSKMHSNEGRYDEAIVAARRMIALNPNDGLGYLALARAAVKAGRAAEGLAAARMAIRLDPRGDDRGTYSYRVGDAQFHMDRYEEAVESFLKVIHRNPAAEWTYLLLAANYGHLGREREASSALETFNAKRAKAGKSPYTIARIEGWAFKEQSYKNRFKEGLRKAGMSAGTSTSAEPEFSASLLPVTVEGTMTIEAEKAKVLFDRGVPFVDVRDPDEWSAGRVPGAVHLELNREFTEARLSEVAAKDHEVVIYAVTTWSTSARACMRAASWGFEKIYYFRAGFSGWKAAGHPVEMPSG